MNISTIVYDHSSFNLSSPEQFQNVSHIYQSLSFLEKEYPGFKKWFYFKVFPSIARGERMIVLKKTQSKIAGLSILKKTSDENKICTIWVDSKYQGKGIGKSILDHSIEILKDDKPLVSVSGNRLEEFSPLFKNFSLKNKYLSIYREGVYEYSFNGHLLKKAESERNVFLNTSVLFRMIKVCA